LILAFSAAHLSADEDSPALVEITVAVPTNQLATELRLTGTVVSQRRSGLSSRAEGLVEEVMVDAGDRVEKGDLLLTLDTKVAELELALIHALIETAEVQLEDAEREREEVKGLTDSGALAKTEAASRETTARIRAAEVKALSVREAQQLEQLERHRLVAPFSGTIARKATEAGEWVETGATVLELIETDPDSLWFDLQVSQEFLPAIREVEEASLILDAFPETPLTAKIDVVVPVKDRISRTFLTRLTLKDPGGLASPGMSGTAVLKVRPKESAGVTIPRDAVMRYPDGSAKVWTVQAENGATIAKSVTVRTAGSLGESVEVVEGLSGGEEVVVRGNEGLTEGQQVKTRQKATSGGQEGL
tara:strand:+ start:686 stop:1768 length:1083 start_codon:yes stop_codon:yes gene_type:complete